MHDYEYADSDGPVSNKRLSDPAVDLAISRVREILEAWPQRLFYSTQIETTLEREFFHWITGKALLELANSRAIQRISHNLNGQIINFYAHRKHRYIQREVKSLLALLNRMFDPEFTHAIGRHGELMFDAALGRHGFRTEEINANTWRDKAWTRTNHNLDRIVTRDGLAYGIEIKNTQNYISRAELQTKLDLCRYLDLIPIFVMRFAPKSYMHEINRARGFGLLFEEQLYPFGHNALLTEVRSRLGLKVNSPRDIKEGDMQRLDKWHIRRIGGQ